MTVTRASWLFAAALAAALGIVVTGQQPATSVFTLEQAAAGRAAYDGELRRRATSPISAASTRRRNWRAATS